MDPLDQPILMQQNDDMDADSSSLPASFALLSLGSPMSLQRAASLAAGSLMSQTPSSQYANLSMKSVLGDNAMNYACCGNQYEELNDLLKHFEDEHIVATDQAITLATEERPQTSEAFIFSSPHPAPRLLPTAKFGHNPTEIALDVPASEIFSLEGHSQQAHSPNNLYSQDSRPTVKLHECPRPNCDQAYRNAKGLAYHMSVGGCKPTNFGSTISRNPAPPLLREGLTDRDEGLFALPFKCGLYGCIQRYKTAYELRRHYQEGHPNYALERSQSNHNLVDDNPSPLSDIGLTEPVDLTGNVSCVGQYPDRGGGYADIFLGLFNEGGYSSTKVAIKVLRSHIYNTSDKAKLRKRLSREIRIWACFDHPNILPLLGTAVTDDSDMSMICPWMDEGDLAGYLNRKGDILTSKLRREICEDITNGLQYIHSRNFIHGDLTTGNVLVNRNGKAKLSDFGLSNMVADLRLESFKTSKVAGSARWAAPELIRTEDDSVAQPKFSSDVYSLGSVIFHVMSSQLPYEGLSDTQVIHEVMAGHKPVQEKPQVLKKNCWDLIEQCWEPVPDDRPRAGEVGYMLAFLK